MHVSGVFTYPIKSCGGLSLQSGNLLPHGIQHDREWMLARADGLFLSQRVLPRMALIQPEVTDEHLVVNAPGMIELRVSLFAERNQLSVGNVWKSTFDAWDEGPEASEWFSEFLGRECRLLRSAGNREVKLDYQVSVAQNVLHCADGFPLLVTSTATLDMLSEHVGFEIPMNRFRPNIVVSGTDLTPGEEDYWRQLAIGSTRVDIVKPCERCPIPDTDQATGERVGDVKPVLTELRLGLEVGDDGKPGPFFGQNAIHQGEFPMVISVGDAVEVVVRANEPNVVFS